MPVSPAATVSPELAALRFSGTSRPADNALILGVEPVAAAFLQPRGIHTRAKESAL